MVVDMRMIQVRAHDGLEAGKALLHKLHADTVGQIRRDLAGLEGLDNVEALNPVRLAPAFLGGFHLPPRRLHAV